MENSIAVPQKIYIHSNIYTLIHTHNRFYTHICTHTYTNTHTHWILYTYMHTHIYTYTTESYTIIKTEGNLAICSNMDEMRALGKVK